MRISQVLASKAAHGGVVTIRPDATVTELLRALAQQGIGAIVVSDDGRSIAGIVSERDIVRAMASDPDQGTSGGVRPLPVSRIMTVDVVTLTEDDDVEDAMRIMTESRIRHLPVVREGELVGLVSIGDVVKARLATLEDEKAALVDYVTRGG